MWFLHFIEHVTEFVDSKDVLLCACGYPIIAPGENEDAPVDQFFGGRSFALYDLVSPGPGVCPDDRGNTESPGQCGDNKT